MYSIGDELSTPVMYQDLAQSSMGYMMPPYGMYGGMYGGFYPPLAGVNIQPQPTADSFARSERKESKDRSALKTALVVLAGVIGFGFLKFKGSKKAVETVLKDSPAAKTADSWFKRAKTWLGISKSK